ncbi:MAG: hypothetical protein DMG73_07290 [Acidobacteria bacterium]|nr:MAG: hypothetical protein DMG73_07290 [Acidobacteriota bacterium]
MAGMLMSGDSASDTSPMKDTLTMSSEGSAHAMNSMQDHHLNMGPHMIITTLRDPNPGDENRADQIAVAARETADKYKDYQAALADGYKIFLPNLPQRQYHFTNNRYAFEAVFRFNPEHPTSLLYQKNGDDYKLIGVMYCPMARPRESVHAASRSEAGIVGGRTRVLDLPVQSQPKKIVMPPVANSCPRFSDGWCTCIRSSRSRPLSGRSSRQAHNHNHGD